MPESSLLKDTLEVTLNNQTYEFAIPSFLDEIKLGVREKNIRKDIEQDLGGDVTGAAEGLDNSTYFLIRVAAVFEVLLRKSSAAWPFSKDDRGNPTVSFKTWPKDKVGEAISVGVAYQDELQRFRTGGLANGIDTEPEVVEGKPDTQPVPLRPEHIKPQRSSA